jgi:hypothetical protein
MFICFRIEGQLRKETMTLQVFTTNRLLFPTKRRYRLQTGVGRLFQAAGWNVVFKRTEKQNLA